MIEATPSGRRAPELPGFAIILMATAIAGVASYAVTILIPNQIGLAKYALFAVFWSSVYLAVGALGGIQQEVTRATLPAREGIIDGSFRACRFGIIAGLAVFATIAGTAPLWERSVFPTEGWSLILPLAVGVASYVMVAVLAGSLYGVIAWIPLAFMITVDALLRVAFLSITLVFTHNIVALAWAVAVPFPLTLLTLWPFIRLSIVGRSRIDDGYRALAGNVARTVLAATGTAIMVTGFPLLLGLTSHSEQPATVGMFIVAITLTRAPLIVVALSLQSYLIVHFRDNAGTFWTYFFRLLGVTFVAGVVLAVAGWLFGPTVFHLIFPNTLQPDAPFFAILACSSALVTALCITAPALLARSKHFVYSTGWVAAAFTTIAALLLPLDFASRTVTALTVGPIVGLVIHGAYLVSAGLGEQRRPTQE